MSGKTKALSEYVMTFHQRQLPPRPVKTRPSFCTKVLPKIIGAFQDVIETKPADLNAKAVHAAILNEWVLRGNLFGLHKRELRRCPWVLFITVEKSPPLGESREFSESYLAAATARRCPSIVAALLYAFLRDYPIELPTFELWRNGVYSLVNATKSQRLNLWRDRHARFDILSSDGPRRVGINLVTQPGKIDILLEDMGLRGELGVSRFCEESCRGSWEFLRDLLVKGDDSVAVLKRALLLSQHNGKLRFGHRKNELACCLLLPFVNKAPKAEIEALIKDYLIEYIGDPRINRSAWNGISRRASDVFRRWMVGITLKDFFKLIDKTAYRKHWKYRKPFWDAYHKAGLIIDAWVVLGSQPAKRAALGELNDMACYGRIQSGGLPDHSVLLLRVGTAVIAERSHTGKCRIWLSGNKHSPELGLKEYRNYPLTIGDDKSFAHHGSDKGRWQYEIAQYMQDNLGIKPPIYNMNT